MMDLILLTGALTLISADPTQQNAIVINSLQKTVMNQFTAGITNVSKHLYQSV